MFLGGVITAAGLWCLATSFGDEGVLKLGFWIGAAGITIALIGAVL
jgi:hypothetical protein